MKGTLEACPGDRAAEFDADGLWQQAADSSSFTNSRTASLANLMHWALDD